MHTHMHACMIRTSWRFRVRKIILSLSVCVRACDNDRNWRKAGKLFSYHSLSQCMCVRVLRAIYVKKRGNKFVLFDITTTYCSTMNLLQLKLLLNSSISFSPPTMFLWHSFHTFFFAFFVIVISSITIELLYFFFSFNFFFGLLFLQFKQFYMVWSANQGDDNFFESANEANERTPLWNVCTVYGTMWCGRTTEKKR